MYTFILINLFGCFSRGKSTDEATIKKDFLEYMQERYDQEFEVLTIKEEANVASKRQDRHFITAVSKQHPDTEFTAKVRYDKDDGFEVLFEYYPQALLAKQLKAEVTKMIPQAFKAYELDVKYANNRKIDFSDYKDTGYELSKILKETSESWTTSVEIKVTDGDVSTDICEELYLEILQFAKETHHHNFNITTKKIENHQTKKTVGLMLENIQAKDITKELVADKIFST